MTTAAIGPIVAEIAGEGFPVVMLHGLGAIVATDVAIRKGNRCHRCHPIQRD